VTGTATTGTDAPRPAAEAPRPRPARLSFRVKLGYGGAEGAGSLVWTVFYTFFLFYLTDVVKMSPGAAGFIVMAGSIWQALLTAPVGLWSDTRRWKWGRRRPFLLATAIPYAIITWLLFTDLGLSPAWTFVYYLAAVIVYFTIFTLEDVPYTALAAEMTQDYDERTSLVTYRTAWSQVVTIVGAAAPLALAGALAGRFGGDRGGWSAMGAIMGACCVLPILLTWRATRGYELFPEKTETRWWELFGAALQNRTFRYMIAIYAVSYMGINLLMAVAVYYLKYVMGYDDNTSSLALLVFVVAGTAWLPLINLAAKRRGKRWALAAFMILWALALVGFVPVGPRSAVVFWLLLLVVPAGAVAATLLTWAMIPDCSEVDEFKTGQRREGLYYGVATFVQQMAVALTLWFVGSSLAWIGYVPDLRQSPGALLGIRLLFGAGTALFALVTLVLALRMPLTREKHAALREAIRRKRQGEPVDTTAFADVL
jgi:sugar (glycoside-pentoside-hexuronide) transporter